MDEPDYFEEPFDDPCPKCGTQLTLAWSGVECSKCGWRFCW